MHPYYQSLQITQIFHWKFFHLELYHTLSIKLIKKTQIFTGPIPIFTGPNQFLLDLSDSPMYFAETVLLKVLHYLPTLHAQKLFYARVLELY